MMRLSRRLPGIDRDANVLTIAHQTITEASKPFGKPAKNLAELQLP
jgi:hypothetical protein